jgi:hypothetical protein
MDQESWKTEFHSVYSRGISNWRSGRRVSHKLFNEQDLRFLNSIGCSAQELADFVEDFCTDGEPDFETVLEVQTIRKDYFTHVLGLKHAEHTARMEDLPPKSEAVDGIAWLPRLIVKARLKLRGEMPSDLMYGCGGDRPFLRRMRSSLPEFLRLVRDCGEDTRRIVDRFKNSAGL